jgi:hypothetical protein
MMNWKTQWFGCLYAVVRGWGQFLRGLGPWTLQRREADANWPALRLWVSDVHQKDSNSSASI